MKWRRLFRRLGRRGVLAALCLCAGLCAVSLALLSSRRLEPPAPPSSRLPGQLEYLAGVNYPWKTGQDFGTGGWGHSGASNPTTYQEIDADFAAMAAQGVRVVKWRVFADGRYSPEFGPDGTVTGLDDRFMADLDAALEIATRHDLRLVLTLFASGLWTADCRTGGVQMGGRAATLLDAAKRRTLVERGVVPMLRHLRGSDRVLAFEVIAEPEWGITELNSDPDGRVKIPLAPVRALVGDLVRAIHSETSALATVESNRASNMSRWSGLGLDYYSFSWYDWVQPYEPLETPVSDLRLDRPVVLGEFPAGGSAYYRLPEVLELTRAQGYAGAFAWSYWSGDGFGEWRNVAPDFEDWVEGRWTGAPSERATAPAPPPSYPYAYEDLDLRADPAGVVVEAKVKVTSGEPYLARVFLYEVGDSQPLEEATMTGLATSPGKLGAHLGTPEPGKAYRVSLGIYSPSYAPLKWFNNLSTFAIENGQIVVPKVEPQVAELNCRP